MGGEQSSFSADVSSGSPQSGGQLGAVFSRLSPRLLPDFLARVQVRQAIANQKAEQEAARQTAIYEADGRLDACEGAMRMHALVERFFARGAGNDSATSEIEVLADFRASSSGKQCRRPLTWESARAALACLASHSSGWFQIAKTVHSTQPASYLRRLPGGSSTAAMASLQNELQKLTEERRRVSGSEDAHCVTRELFCQEKPKPVGATCEVLCISSQSEHLVPVLNSSPSSDCPAEHQTTDESDGGDIVPTPEMKAVACPNTAAATCEKKQRVQPPLPRSEPVQRTRSGHVFRKQQSVYVPQIIKKTRVKKESVVMIDEEDLEPVAPSCSSNVQLNGTIACTPLKHICRKERRKEMNALKIVGLKEQCKELGQSGLKAELVRRLLKAELSTEVVSESNVQLRTQGQSRKLSVGKACALGDATKSRRRLIII